VSDASIELHIEGVDAALRVSSCRVHETIGSAVRAEISLAAFLAEEPTELASLGALGRRATLTLRHHEVERRFEGVVEALDERSSGVELTLVSPVGTLGDTCDYRVFVDASATEIVEKVLGEHGIRLSLRARRSAPKRAHCVQVFESDLAFCSRLLAEEGMSWIAVPDDPGLLLVADEPDTFVDRGTTIPWRAEAGLELGRALHEARASERVVVEQSTLRDYDFRHPMLDLHGASGEGSLEHYEFPGGFTSAAEGAALAAIRLGELQAEASMLEGSATEPELQAGFVLTVESAPDELPEARWLVVAVVHDAKLRAGQGELAYEARFRAVPASRGLRSARPARPAHGGVGTAVVTGAAGQEIALDEHGRARVLLRWDRRSAPDAQSSGAARVVQPQLSGSIFNPRVGWEELVAFSDEGAEIPLLLGRVYNAAQAPPASLPAKKVETHFGTMTTPSGSSGNFLRISDEAGNEGMSLNATGVYDERIENDRGTAIAVNHLATIAGSRQRIVHERLVEAVAGEQSIAVGGLRTVAAGTNYGVAAGSERVIVGSARLIRAGGDYLTMATHFGRVVGSAKHEIGIEHQSVFTQGASTLLVRGTANTTAAASASIGVLGAAAIKVSDVQSISTGGYGLTVRGLYSESFASRAAQSAGPIAESFGKVTYDVSGSGDLAASSVTIAATASLVIKGGGLTITMTPGSITVQGTVEGSGPLVEEGSSRYG
jgi:type VI secretion system secreted protein VgrG